MNSLPAFSPYLAAACCCWSAVLFWSLLGFGGGGSSRFLVSSPDSGPLNIGPKQQYLSAQLIRCDTAARTQQFETESLLFKKRNFIFLIYFFIH
jgi:hypothetical protein